MFIPDLPETPRLPWYEILWCEIIARTALLRLISDSSQIPETDPYTARAYSNVSDMYALRDSDRAAEALLSIEALNRGVYSDQLDVEAFQHQIKMISMGEQPLGWPFKVLSPIRESNFEWAGRIHETFSLRVDLAASLVVMMGPDRAKVFLWKERSQWVSDIKLKRRQSHNSPEMRAYRRHPWIEVGPQFPHLNTRNRRVGVVLLDPEKDLS